MRLRSFILFSMMSCTAINAFSQGADSTRWEIGLEANNYFIPGNYILDPVVTANHNKLHLEARYNYEDLRTLSAWAGYNFHWTKKVDFAFTPMVGIVLGNTQGIAPGFEFDFNYRKFEIYSETEYLLDTGDKNASFYYNWTDITYNLKEWLWFGMSIQRTRLYRSELELQKAPLVGFQLKKWQLTTYGFDLGTGSAFVLVTLGRDF